MDNEHNYTETESISWGSRIGGSIKGIFGGIILILISIGLLWWNEGRAVKRARALTEGAAAMVSVSADQVNPANNEMLVHLTGEATTKETLKDSEFGLSVNAIKLIRDVQMYQWVESVSVKEEKKLGGKIEKVKTYSYEKAWKGALVNSSKFKKQQGHENPAVMPYKNRKWKAKKVNMGAFKLSTPIVLSLNEKTGVTAKAQKLPANATMINEGEVSLDGVDVNAVIYVGNDFKTPQVGDVKISYKAVLPGEYSVVAKQLGKTLTPYATSNGETINLVQAGVASGDQMFQAAESSNSMWTWILRFVGFLLMSTGFGMLLKPLVVLADVVPFIGDLLQVGVSLISGVVAFAVSFVTIAIAWIFYRPILGASLLIIGLATLIFFIRRGHMKRKAAEEEKEAVMS